MLKCIFPGPLRFLLTHIGTHPMHLLHSFILRSMIQREREERQGDRDIQIDRQTNRERGCIDRQKHRHTYRQTERERGGIDRHTHRHTYRQTERGGGIDRHTHRHTYRHTDRQTGIQTNRWRLTILYDAFPLSTVIRYRLYAIKPSPFLSNTCRRFIPSYRRLTVLICFICPKKGIFSSVSDVAYCI